MLIREITWGRLLDALAENGTDVDGLHWVLTKVGEQLNMSEAEHMECFLEWMRSSGRWIGSGNYKDRWNEFVSEGGLVKDLKLPAATPVEELAKKLDLVQHIKVGSNEIQLHKFNCAFKSAKVIAWNPKTKQVTFQL